MGEVKEPEIRRFLPEVPARSGEGFLEELDGLGIPLLLEARQSLAPDLEPPEVPPDTRVPQEQIGQRDRLVVVRHEHRHVAQHVDRVPRHGRSGVYLVVHLLELALGDIEDEGRRHGPQPGTIAVVDPDLPEDEHLRVVEAHRRQVGVLRQDLLDHGDHLARGVVPLSVESPHRFAEPQQVVGVLRPLPHPGQLQIRSASHLVGAREGGDLHLADLAVRRQDRVPVGAGSRLVAAARFELVEQTVGFHAVRPKGEHLLQDPDRRLHVGRLRRRRQEEPGPLKEELRIIRPQPRARLELGARRFRKVAAELLGAEAQTPLELHARPSIAAPLPAPRRRLPRCRRERGGPPPPARARSTGPDGGSS